MVPIISVVCFELELELDGVKRHITFEGRDLPTEARDAVQDWRGGGCSTRDCVAEIVCKAMAAVVADEHERGTAIMGPFEPCGNWDAGFRVAMADLARLNWVKGDHTETADRALSFARGDRIAQAETVRKHFQQVADASFEAFERRTYGITAKLDALIANETAEGGLFNAHHNSIFPDAGKRECWVNFVLSSAATRGVEIGFNAGYSAAMFLELLPNATLESYDLCRYDYTLRARRLLESHYDHRLVVICGDSRTTLAKRQDDADFFFIDGEHTFDAASSDLDNAKRLAKPGSTVIVDDCHGAVADAWTAALDAGWLANRHKGLCWRGMCVGVVVG